MASRDVVIRPARPQDLPAMGRLGAALAAVHHAFDPERFFVVENMHEGYAWWLGKELANRRAVLLVAARGRRVVGYAYGRLEGRDWNALREPCGHAIDLVVEPDARGRGIGRKLAQALFDALAALGAPRVVLETAARNRRAQALFGSLGFRPTMLEMTREATSKASAAPISNRPARRRNSRVAP
ncbi:MAG TPA: GNAT family N-acetyltransferase [Anaeromyxobacteraceae bacterium]|nr:GNAT family N-acetyltransferase [Anaeromyxobacteraceae bacterium]